MPREILVEEMVNDKVSASSARGGYNQWIIDRDGSTLEPSEQDSVNTLYEQEAYFKLHKSAKCCCTQDKICH